MTAERDGAKKKFQKVLDVFRIFKKIYKKTEKPGGTSLYLRKLFEHECKVSITVLTSPAKFANLKFKVTLLTSDLEAWEMDL